MRLRVQICVLTGCSARTISLSPYVITSSDSEYVPFLGFSRQVCSHIHILAFCAETHIISVNNKEVYIHTTTTAIPPAIYFLVPAEYSPVGPPRTTVDVMKKRNLFSLSGQETHLLVTQPLVA